MMVDSFIFQAEAEARWLELCEARLATMRAQPLPAPGETGGPRRGARAMMRVLSVSLTVAAGEMLAVMGPSGSGKSTLLQLAGGLARPTSGRVVLHGIDLGTLRDAELSAVLRRRVGFVFQDINLLAALTAAENVSLPLELDGVRPRRAMAAARALLSSLDLDGVADRLPAQMSGGPAAASGRRPRGDRRPVADPGRRAHWRARLAERGDGDAAAPVPY